MQTSPTESKFSSSQRLNGKQIRKKLDAILPSLAHIMQGKQTRAKLLQMLIRVIHSTASKQVIMGTHFTLVKNRPKIRETSRSRRTFKIGQFPKVASDDVTLIYCGRNILQRKLINQARTTPLTQHLECVTTLLSKE